jgi:N-acetylmuramoyl-L-alanine amidase
MSARRALAVAALFAAPFLMGVERPRGLGDVADVRTWTHEGYTRVVVETSRAVETRVVRLPADAGARRPERLYLDMEGIWVGLDYQEGIPIGDGLLRDVRLGQNTLSRTRVVLDLESYAHHRLITLESPHRVVIDVYGSQRGRPSVGRYEPNARLSMPLRSIHTVVVDPGHGGRDPGAIGRKGLREKDVNLRLGRKLAAQLKERGFRVVMTRDSDRSLNLEERTVIAESSGGDLFVSLHANSSPRRGTRGIEIFYLDEDVERHSLEVAARENGIERAQVDTLQHTLARLRVSEASVHSSALAQLVHDQVVPGVAAHYRGVADLGVKKAPFYVLFLSSMPSILFEAGFLTNREDVKLLRSDDYLDVLAQGIAAGLENYRDRGRRIAYGGGG